MPSLQYKPPDYNTIIEVARKRKVSRYLDKKIREGLKEKRYISQLNINDS